MSGEKVDPAPPVGIDLDRPSVARIYDYYLGGTTNWAVDREFGDRALEKVPLLRDIALANRMFLNRVVRHLAGRGVRQFLDIGAGVPTAGNTHEVADEFALAQRRRPEVRVVYVDNEPVAVAHAEILLDERGDPNRHAVVDADLRDPDEVWATALDTELLDPHEPVALLLVAVLHVHQAGPDGRDVGAESVARFRELLPAGSLVAISHVTDDGVPAEGAGHVAELKRMYDASSSSDLVVRTRAQIAALLGDWPLLDPGWTWTPCWHPEETGPNVRTITFPTPSHALLWSGVGRKP
ncbi:MAG TPA: SAM-dependent methyltransferase [Actinophytocola sp.]|nr:SAM-dependent methyltransferase [Actinophytocola sp.]